MNKGPKYPIGQRRRPRPPGGMPPGPAVRKKNANLGKELELYLEQANEMYNIRNRSIVFRQHPEVTVIRRGEKIVDAFFKSKAGLDYIGLSSGRSFTFDAKETRSATNYPLDKIKDHQAVTMQRFTDQGGFSFLLIRFVKHHEIYMLTYEQLAPWWEGYLGSGRKSIPYQWIQENCERINAGAGLAIDYMPVVEKFIKAK